MIKQFQINANHRSRERQIINALLTLATGVLTLIFPNFLYLIAGAYLVALGVMFLTFRFPTFFAAVPIIAGVLIFIFPELIPPTFAAFLGLFGLMFLFGLQLSILGILMIVIAVLIVMNPDSVAYLIAFFMLVYATSNLFQFYREWKNKQDEGDGFDNDKVTIEE
ncbi:hypothetical protein [Gracilimonas mengyeensis]|uniref:Uncharacterized protein n=1 Tax=Gracilimonas mengyeensis TaxID=1302730 RepID=A0A521CWT6_9BACT|nr:hypothetical protein [Gracilimonas mengyeensis]SMO63915.1 hypothetical protein SAMN06265219_106182 [Gracilimonas mengyeensis]